ncbi:hypothetical protein ABT117_24085, partial [Streptomyces sp. NPDC002262]
MSTSQGSHRAARRGASATLPVHEQPTQAAPLIAPPPTRAAPPPGPPPTLAALPVAAPPAVPAQGRAAARR